MAASDANARKRQRKEELRDYLSNRGKVDYVFNNIEKIESLDASSTSFQQELLKLKTANEQRIRLLNKYLPDVKDDGDIDTSSQPITINLVKPEDDNG
jgi:hypothetical protein